MLIGDHARPAPRVPSNVSTALPVFDAIPVVDAGRGGISCRRNAWVDIVSPLQAGFVGPLLQLRTGLFQPPRGLPIPHERL